MPDLALDPVPTEVGEPPKVGRIAQTIRILTIMIPADGGIVDGDHSCAETISKSRV
jgi:hypothetical protein